MCYSKKVMLTFQRLSLSHHYAEGKLGQLGTVYSFILVADSTPYE